MKKTLNKMQAEGRPAPSVTGSQSYTPNQYTWSLALPPSYTTEVPEDEIELMAATSYRQKQQQSKQQQLADSLGANKIGLLDGYNNYFNELEPGVPEGEESRSSGEVK